jgi:hypothetical protein
MNIPQIRMEQTFARLGLHIRKPVQEIEQPPAELNLRQVPARMEIHRTNPRVLIDQSECRADIDLKNIFRRNAEWAMEGRQAVLNAIARISQEGKILRSIESGGNKLKQIAIENTFKQMVPSQITFVPKYGSLKIEGIPVTTEIRWQIGGVQMDPVIRKPVINYTPGRVEGYIEQKNSLKIWVEGNIDVRL